jgi:hypothetical protein
MKSASSEAGVGCVPVIEAARFDLIHEIALDMPPNMKRLDWPEAVALAIDAWHSGRRGDARREMREHNPALWAHLSNKAAAVAAFDALRAGDLQFEGGPI